jgi:hypothetical protein
MVWGGITARNRTQLVIIDGNLNAATYRGEVLAPVVVPFLKLQGPGIILQQAAGQRPTPLNSCCSTINVSAATSGCSSLALPLSANSTGCRSLVVVLSLSKR